MRTSVKRKRLGDLFERQQTATVEEVVKAYHGEEELEEMMKKARRIDKSKWAKEFKDKYGASPISFESALKAKAKALADAGVMQLSKGETKVQIIADPSDQFKAGIRINSEADEAAFREVQSSLPTLSELESQELIRKTMKKNKENLQRTLIVVDPAYQRKVENFIFVKTTIVIFTTQPPPTSSPKKPRTSSKLLWVGGGLTRFRLTVKSSARFSRVI